MPAKRCSLCATNWPLSYHYAVCPTCQERTDVVTNATAISTQEAKRMVSEIKFAKFYAEKWEPERTGPDPDEVGRREAAELARAWREVTLGFDDQSDQSDQ